MWSCWWKGNRPGDEINNRKVDFINIPLECRCNDINKKETCLPFRTDHLKRSGDLLVDPSLVSVNGCGCGGSLVSYMGELLLSSQSNYLQFSRLMLSPFRLVAKTKPWWRVWKGVSGNTVWYLVLACLEFAKKDRPPFRMTWQFLQRCIKYWQNSLASNSSLVTPVQLAHYPQAVTHTQGKTITSLL